jgi:putative transposon-encoded protein
MRRGARFVLYRLRVAIIRDYRAYWTAQGASCTCAHITACTMRDNVAKCVRALCLVFRGNSLARSGKKVVPPFGESGKKVVPPFGESGKKVVPPFGALLVSAWNRCAFRRIAPPLKVILKELLNPVRACVCATRTHYAPQTIIPASEHGREDAWRNVPSLRRSMHPEHAAGDESTVDAIDRARCLAPMAAAA